MPLVQHFNVRSEGAILIILILSMVIVAGLGTAGVSMYATATYNQVGSSNTIRTQHMAESGGRFTKDYITKDGVDAAETYFNNGGTNLVFNLSGNDGSFSTNFTRNEADDEEWFVDELTMSPLPEITQN